VAAVVLAVCAAQLPQQAAAVLWNLLYLSRQEFLTQSPLAQVLRVSITQSATMVQILYFRQLHQQAVVVVVMAALRVFLVIMAVQAVVVQVVLQQIQAVLALQIKGMQAATEILVAD
jgi:hypothetical protein